MLRRNCEIGPISSSPALETGRSDSALPRKLSAVVLRTSDSMVPSRKPLCQTLSMPVTSEQQFYRTTPHFGPCTRTRYLTTCRVPGQSFSPLTVPRSEEHTSELQSLRH